MRLPDASTNRRVIVAMPDSRCRKFSATRSPRQQRARRSRHLGDDGAGLNRLSLDGPRRDRRARIDQPEDRGRHVRAGEHERRLREQDAAAVCRRRHGGLGRHVTRADVFFERTADEVERASREPVPHHACGGARVTSAPKSRPRARSTCSTNPGPEQVRQRGPQRLEMGGYVAHDQPRRPGSSAAAWLPISSCGPRPAPARHARATGHPPHPRRR